MWAWLDGVDLWTVGSKRSRTAYKLLNQTGQGPVECLAFGRAGKTVAAAVETDTIGLCDTATGKLLARFEACPVKWSGYWFFSVAFSPDGNTLAAGNGNVGRDPGSDPSQAIVDEPVGVQQTADPRLNMVRRFDAAGDRRRRLILRG